MFPFGGAVTVSVPLPFVNVMTTMRWSMSNACVGAPGRIITTDEIFAASGVETVNPPPHEIVLGRLVIVGRVARAPLELKRYAGW